MDDVRGADQTPGEFRRSQNFIGRPPKYVPPPVNRLSGCLDAFEKYLHAPRELNPLVEAFIVHYQFEAIHPFGDGNGRVGRLLLAITIAEWCGLTRQWLYMSSYFERNKDRYVDLLFRVSATGAWESWVEFCLQGVVQEARDTQQRCDRLLALHQQFRQAIADAGGSIRLSSIVDALFETPIVLVTTVQRDFTVTYPTARSDLKKLAKAGIIQRIEGFPQIAYSCPEIFDVIYKDVA